MMTRTCRSPKMFPSVVASSWVALPTKAEPICGHSCRHVIPSVGATTLGISWWRWWIPTKWMVILTGRSVKRYRVLCSRAVSCPSRLLSLLVARLQCLSWMPKFSLRMLSSRLKSKHSVIDRMKSVAQKEDRTKSKEVTLKYMIARTVI